MRSAAPDNATDGRGPAELGPRHDLGDVHIAQPLDRARDQRRLERRGGCSIDDRDGAHDRVVETVADRGRAFLDEARDLPLAGGRGARLRTKRQARRSRSR